MWETILGVVIGAVVSFFPAWFFSNRSHKWELEEKKRVRVNNAREIRLKEGEEIITEHSREFYYFERLCKLLLYAKSPIELITMSESFIADYKKSWEEVNKGITINETSINSLNDKELTQTWNNAHNSFDSYVHFCTELDKTFRQNGLDAIQNDKSFAKQEQALRQGFISSVEAFKNRINVLRSQ